MSKSAVAGSYAESAPHIADIVAISDDNSDDVVLHAKSAALAR